MVAYAARQVSMEILLAGSVGALIVFFLGMAREWWRNRRERRGLLRLLLAEIDHNVEVVEAVGQTKPALISSPDLPSMKMEAWRGTRVRVAQLLPEDLLTDLQAYYSPLETLLTLLTFSNAGSNAGNRWLRAAIAEDLGEVPRPRDPYVEYMKKTLDAQDQVRTRVANHLSLPWWRTRMFVGRHKANG